MTRFGGYTRDELHLDGSAVWVPGVSDGCDHCIIARVDDVSTDGKHIIQARPCGSLVIVPWRAHDKLPDCRACKRWYDARQWALTERPSRLGWLVRGLLGG